MELEQGQEPALVQPCLTVPEPRSRGPCPHLHVALRTGQHASADCTAPPHLVTTQEARGHFPRSLGQDRRCPSEHGSECGSCSWPAGRRGFLRPAQQCGKRLSLSTATSCEEPVATASALSSGQCSPLRPLSLVLLRPQGTGQVEAPGRTRPRGGLESPEGSAQAAGLSQEGAGQAMLSPLSCEEAGRPTSGEPALACILPTDPGRPQEE